MNLSDPYVRFMYQTLGREAVHKTSGKTVSRADFFLTISQNEKEREQLLNGTHPDWQLKDKDGWLNGQMKSEDRKRLLNESACV